jgi:hypothetical protein
MWRCKLCNSNNNSHNLHHRHHSVDEGEDFQFVPAVHAEQLSCGVAVVEDAGK